MPNALIIAPPSDAHTWNLFYLQLLVQEQGFFTEILGGCVTFQEITDKVKTQNWDLIIVSSLNGHFYIESQDVITAILEGLSFSNPPIIAGGKLDIHNQDLEFMEKVLLKQGYDRLFFRQNSPDEFRSYCKKISLCFDVAC